MHADWLEILACHLVERGDRRVGVGWHRHRQPQWYLCTAGSLRIACDDADHLLQPGEHLLIPAGRRRQPEVGTTGDYTALMLRFRSSRIDPLRWPRQPLPLPSGCGEQVHRLLDRLMTRAEPDALAEALLLGLLLTIQEQSAPTTALEPSSDPLPQDRLIAAAENHIRTHLAGPLTRDSIAQAVHSSASSLGRAYRARRHYSIREAVTAARMQEARRLLLHSEAAVGQIANRLGFATASHFTVRFKKFHGLTPLVFRRERGRIWWVRRPTDGGPVLD